MAFRFTARSVAACVLLTAAAARAQEADQTLVDLEAKFKAVTCKVAPAVVAISASNRADDSPASCRPAALSPAKLEAFLSTQTRVVGTGCLVDPEGYILTNDHVVADGEQLWVTTDDRKVYPAVIVGSDPRSDLAVLKIPGHGFPTVHFGDGAAVKRGQWSVAIGNPYGLASDGGECVSVGVVSAVNRSLPKLSEKENRLYSNLIQTTAQINPGSSGGPLFDLHGDVIGINTAVVMPQKAINAIGFAVPADDRLRDLTSRLMAGEPIVYGYFGVVTSTPTDEQKKRAGLTDGAAHVDFVEPDSPAESAGVKAGDELTAIDNQPVTDADRFGQIIGRSPTTRAIRVTVLRDGNPRILATTLIPRPTPTIAVSTSNQHMRWAGVTIGTGDGGLAVISIDPGSEFARKHNLHVGDAVRAVDGKPVKSVIGFQSAVAAIVKDDCDLTVEQAVAKAE